MTDAPAEVGEHQLKELHMQWKLPEADKEKKKP